MNLGLARTVADAVLYEGYLLYPYRASSSKNRARWQFGVLGPPGAATGGLGEEPSMAMQCLVDADPGEPATVAPPRLVLHLRFLQIQRRQVLDAEGQEVAELEADGTTWTTWDEAVDQELTFTASLEELGSGWERPGAVDGGEDVELLTAADGSTVGQVVRRRWPLSARVRASTTAYGRFVRLEVGVDNVHGEVPTTKADAVRRSFIGTHLLLEAHGVGFVSLLEPADEASDAAAACTQRRCWPVLAGSPGDTDLLLGLPIILYDYPEVAAESAGALFDATEIDEILTLRVLTMTEQEKAEARATDPRAREIIDRCDAMTPETLQLMHGALRSPHAGEPVGMPEMHWPGLGDFGEPVGVPEVHWPGLGEVGDARDVDPQVFRTGDVPWWDPEADAAVQPEVDVVVIQGVRVSKGSLVRVHPNRRADAQDIFFADQIARVTAVLSDVDGGTHVAVVLVDDPAADLHDWYGRYFYFAPDELEPLPVGVPPT